MIQQRQSPQPFSFALCIHTTIIIIIMIIISFRLRQGDPTGKKANKSNQLLCLRTFVATMCPCNSRQLLNSWCWYFVVMKVMYEEIFQGTLVSIAIPANLFSHTFCSFLCKGIWKSPTLNVFSDWAQIFGRNFSCNNKVPGFFLENLQNIRFQGWNYYKMKEAYPSDTPDLKIVKKLIRLFPVA